MELGIDDKTIRQIKPLIIPVVTIIASVVLAYVFGNSFWGNISSLRNDIRNNNREKNVLEEKLNILQENRVAIQEARNVVTTALPTNSSAIFTLNHLINLQAEYEIAISDLQVIDSSNVNDDSEINTVGFNFVATGSYRMLADFLSELDTISPLVKIEEIVISSSDSEFESEVELWSYYSESPESIPAIDDPIEDLTDNEKAIVSVIREYKQPAVDASTETPEREGKDNPFILEDF